MLMLDNLRTLLGIVDKDKDGLLQFVLDCVTDQVKAYCNIDEIPTGLERIIVRMAADMYRSEGYGNEVRDGAVKSVSRGDQSTSFDSSPTGSLEGGKSILDNYTALLNSYRKLRW